MKMPTVRAPQRPSSPLLATTPRWPDFCLQRLTLTVLELLSCGIAQSVLHGATFSAEVHPAVTCSGPLSAGSILGI